jgi:hypothetical protein
MVRSGLVLVLVVLSTCALAAPALASGPPTGKYGCAIGSGGQYAGDLRVLSSHRYRLNRSKIGRFIVHPGRKLTFPTGVWHKLFKGRWYKTSDGKWEVALTSLASGFETQYCDKES